MANVPALSPLWLLPEEAAKYNIQVEQVIFQRFADERTALASGDLDIAAFGPQDIILGLGQGAKSMVGVAGVGSGNDCLLVRKGEDVKDWAGVASRRVGILLLSVFSLAALALDAGTVELVRQAALALGHAHKRFGPDGSAVRILYGGSVKPGNAAELVARHLENGGTAAVADEEYESLGTRTLLLPPV